MVNNYDLTTDVFLSYYVRKTIKITMRSTSHMLIKTKF